MAQGYRIWPDRISISYGTQPRRIEGEVNFNLVLKGRQGRGITEEVV
jgi:hypothetical protein